MAIITVNEEGENYIVLSEGANGRLTEEDVATEVKWDGVYAVRRMKFRGRRRSTLSNRPTRQAFASG